MPRTCFLPIAYGDEPTAHYRTREDAAAAVSPSRLIGVLTLTDSGEFRCADPTCQTEEQ